LEFKIGDKVLKTWGAYEGRKGEVIRIPNEKQSIVLYKMAHGTQEHCSSNQFLKKI
jgi:hypothetical protein